MGEGGAIGACQEDQRPSELNGDAGTCTRAREFIRPCAQLGIPAEGLGRSRFSRLKSEPAPPISARANASGLQPTRRYRYSGHSFSLLIAWLFSMDDLRISTAHTYSYIHAVFARFVRGLFET